MDFRTGKIKESVKRNSFGGSLKNTTKNDREESYEMYGDIWEINQVIITKTYFNPTLENNNIKRGSQTIISYEDYSEIDLFTIYQRY